MAADNPDDITIAGTTVTAGVKSIRIAFNPAGFTFKNSQTTVGSCPASLTATIGGDAAHCYITGYWANITKADASAIPGGTAFTAVLAAGSINTSVDVSMAPWSSITVSTFNGTQSDNTAIDTGTATLSWPETVAFSANGGTGTMASQTSSTAQNLTANSFTRAGYRFDGWSFYVGGPKEYADQASYPFTTNSKSIRTLYARWVTPSISTNISFVQGTVGTAVNKLILTAAGFSSPVTTFALRTGTLPSGLTLTKTGDYTAEVTGTPTSDANACLYFDATNASETGGTSNCIIFAIAPDPNAGSGGGSSGGSSGGSGGAGSPTVLPTPKGTVVEVDGPAIRVSVDSLDAGASLVVKVFPTSFVPSPSMTEEPLHVALPAGTTSVSFSDIKWKSTATGQITRTEALKVGTEYQVDFAQIMGSVTSPTANSLFTRVKITLTGTVAATPTPSTAQTPSAAATPTTPALTTSKTEVVPGVTVTDTKVYAKAPAKVASGSAITVLTPTQVKTQTIRTSTPAVCVPTTDDIVFIDEGRCNATVLSKKTGEVLRRLRTTVVESDVTELGIGNEIVTLAPIYFDGGSADLNPAALKRLRALKERITAAGTVMVVGHSGTLMGNTPENVAMSRDRAVNTVRAMKRIGAKGPFYSTGAGALDPVTRSSDRTEQNKNRRVVVVLVP